MKLYVGFESTWSLRALICADISRLTVEKIALPLSGDGFKARLIEATTTGLVPALGTGKALIADSLAISEYFNELSGGKLYPADQTERALARSLVCELHAGFFGIRSACPFSSHAVEPLLDRSGVENELLRIEEIFSNARGDFMFDEPSIVDAFYSVLALRLSAYGINLEGKAGAYQNALIAWPMLKAALAQNDNWSSL